MSERFELFRFSLLKRDQRVLGSGPDPTREQYLRDVFNHVMKFEYYRNDFHYVPEAQTVTREALLGRIGRPVTIEENLPPQQGLAEVLHDAWKAAVIVIDPRDHEDGQKVAVEDDPKVGSPSGMLNKMVDKINEEHPEAPYTIYVEAISQEAEFWQWAEENKGAVTSLTFEFIAPNMFGASDEIDKELRGFREKEKAGKVTVTLANSDGLNTDTEKVKQSVNYTARGTGRIKAKGRGKNNYFDSQNKKKVAYLEADSKESALKRAADKTDKVLGRE